MSDNAIFFFSGTGNSFDVAKRLTEKLHNTRLYNIANLASNDSISKYERVGIIFPVYGFTLPNIVKRFIQTMPFNKDTYYFCVPTMGAFAFGAFYRTSEVFTAAGGHLDYINNVYMPENYILFSNVPSDKLIAKHLANSHNRVNEIARDVASKKLKPATKPFSYRFVEKISKEESKKWKYTAQSFRVSSDCIKCEKCVRLCPVGNIQVEDYSISFSNHCECCLSCIHACPTQAINFGTITIGKKRYINPNIDIERMKDY
jgi:ferredoxin/flavodoxin